MPFVLTAMEDSIGTIVLNQPEKRNALSQALITDLLDALRAFQEQSARVITAGDS